MQVSGLLNNVKVMDTNLLAAPFFVLLQTILK